MKKVTVNKDIEMLQREQVSLEVWFTLYEKCPYSENYGPYFSAFGENTERYKACTPNTEKFGPEKLLIRILVPNC